MDVSNPGDDDDPELMIRARQENMVLVTRDKRLAENCRTAGVECILLQSTSLLGQLNEMAKKGVKMELDPQRCTVCNGPLRAVRGATTSPSMIGPGSAWSAGSCTGLDRTGKELRILLSRSVRKKTNSLKDVFRIKTLA